MEPADGQLSAFDFIILIAVLAAIAYGLVVLVPVFASEHMPVIALVIVVGALVGFLVDRARFQAGLRRCGLYLLFAAAAYLLAGILFRHRYDALAAKAASGGLFAFIYLQTTSKPKPNDTEQP